MTSSCYEYKTDNGGAAYIHDLHVHTLNTQQHETFDHLWQRCLNTKTLWMILTLENVEYIFRNILWLLKDNFLRQALDTKLRELHIS